MTERKPTQHNMMRRSAAHDYSRPGIYHITLHVAEGMGQPLGTVAGCTEDDAHVVLSVAGSSVEHELQTAITAHYPMVTVDAYVIMPDHLHFILIVHQNIVSKSGRSTHLGQVIAGFKKGCNRAYWAATGQEAPAVGAAGQNAAAKPPRTVSSGSATGKPRYSTGRSPLFAPGYCDVMPIESGQLKLQRTYIKDNPRSRWLRTHDRSRLQPQRGGIDTAVTLPALRRYLQNECPPSLIGADALASIERRLLLADGKIICDSYGDRALLQRRLLPVVCHRRDTSLFATQKSRCLAEAAKGGVLVSARIAKGEQGIIDETVNHGYPVILVADNGFPAIYHPSTERIAQCSEGGLLLVTPWLYEYRGKNERVSVPFCKTMNCISQALCRTKDSWWKQQ